MNKKAMREEKKKDFLSILVSVKKEQLSDFIKSKGREPKMIKPFICLNSKQ